jgi:hypothetical protein
MSKQKYVITSDGVKKKMPYLPPRPEVARAHAQRAASSAVGTIQPRNTRRNRSRAARRANDIAFGS